MTITEAQRAALREALLSPDLTICSGIGDAVAPGIGEACTIAEINLVLTGLLDDGPHPCMSEVIRWWVIRIQDALPTDIRNSAAWREAAVGIAGSAASESVERTRSNLILDWMWSALADDAVLAVVPAGPAREAWDRMLSERTISAANAASADAANAAMSAHVAISAHAINAAAHVALAAARAAHAYPTDRAVGHAAHAAAEAADAAASAVGYAARAAAAYWGRRDAPGMLIKLIEATSDDDA